MADSQKPSFGLLNGGTITAEAVARLYEQLTGRACTGDELLDLQERFGEKPMQEGDPTVTPNGGESFEDRVRRELADESAAPGAASESAEADPEADPKEGDQEAAEEDPDAEDDSEEPEEDSEDDAQDRDKKPPKKPVPPKSLRERLEKQVLKDYDPNQPRDELGMWTDGGAGAAIVAERDDHGGRGRDPRAWRDNKQEPIEKRAEAARGRAQALLEQASSDGEEAEVSAQSWDDLESDIQDSIEQSWKDGNEEQYRQGAIESWRENIDTDIADRLRDGEDDWAREFFADWAEQNGFDRESAERAYRGADANDGIDFDRNAMEMASGTGDPNYESLQKLDELQSDWEDRFKEEVEVQEQGDVPDHVFDQVSQDVDDAWDALDSDEKFEYATEAGVVDETSVAVAEPEHVEPISGGIRPEAYKETGAALRYLQDKITSQELEARGIVNHDGVDTKKVASLLWERWKGSSTSGQGLLLQHAAAEELGGLKQKWDEKQEESIRKAAIDLSEKHDGGYGGHNTPKPDGTSMTENDHYARGIEIAKAHVHGTWAASQWAMEKAGMESLPVYRGLMLEKSLINKEPKEEVAGKYMGYTKLPELELLRNGAASATSDPSTANGWGGVGTSHLVEPVRVVMRVDVPRESILSLPAFGQNVHNEQEVVIVGGKWKAWDAWLNRAPDEQEAVPIKAALVNWLRARYNAAGEVA
jgi:hypothetical protein